MRRHEAQTIPGMHLAARGVLLFGHAVVVPHPRKEADTLRERETESKRSIHAHTDTSAAIFEVQSNG